MVSMAELRSDWRKIPNILTIARLVLSPIPGIMYLMYSGDFDLRMTAMIIFVAVVLTDALDGYLARRNNQVTTLGKMLDPIVDKVLIITTLLSISIINPFILTPTLIIILRETSVTLIRTRARQKGIVISAVSSGKVKMVFQSIMTAMLLAPFDGSTWLLATVNVIIVTVIITLYSWYDYHNQFSQHL